jgi:P-type conjugative transfer ATPase TrbB
VAVTLASSEAFSRGARMLRTALGPAIATFLEDPSIVEVMLNPDGRLWIDRLSGGLEDSGRTISAADGERIVRLVAHHVGAEVHAERPRVSAELPETGERFEGLLPPVVVAPAFAIRKPAVAIFTLHDYVAAGVMAADQAAVLRKAVADRKNILVAGGTSTGKTTLTNALLAEIAGTTDRVVLIEDTRELQCRAPNLVALRTRDGIASLSDLVRSSLRLRPDRIPIGEVRGAEPPRVTRLSRKVLIGLGVVSALAIAGALGYLLIPQGAKLIGQYDSSVAFGQSRLLLVWTRLIMPDGSSIVLERQPGADAGGYAGLEDEIDNHWDKLLEGAVLSTLLSVGAEAGTGQNENNLVQAIRSGASNSTSQTGQQIIQRQLNVQPTLAIRQGFPVRVVVTRDLVLAPYGAKP